MYSDIDNFSCIYKITNLVNNKFYIGSCYKIKVRKQKHLYDLRNNRHHSAYLQNSFNKYGESNFRFEVIEELKFPINYNRTLIKEHLLNREQYYIDTLSPEYNIQKEAGSNLGFRFSESSKRKLSESRRGKKNGFYGKHHSRETIKKVIEANTKNGNYDNCVKIFQKWNDSNRRLNEDTIIKIYDLDNSGFVRKEIEYLALATNTQLGNLFNNRRHIEIKNKYNLLKRDLRSRRYRNKFNNREL